MDDLTVGNIVEVEGRLTHNYIQLTRKERDEFISLKEKERNIVPEKNYTDGTTIRYLIKYDIRKEKCVFLGWSYMDIGVIEYDSSYYSPHLQVEKRIKVAVVSTVKENNQYRKPFRCLPEQIGRKFEYVQDA